MLLFAVFPLYTASKESSRPREKKNMSESGNKMGTGAYCKLETFWKRNVCMVVVLRFSYYCYHYILLEMGKWSYVFVVFCYKTIISTWKISRDHMKGSARKSMGLATGWWREFTINPKYFLFFGAIFIFQSLVGFVYSFGENVVIF